MLEIRRIRAGEVIDSNKIGVIAFNGRHDFTKSEAPDPLSDPFDWTWGAFEDGKIVSKIVELPYVMRFDGHDAKMSGIGGVATLPEARRGGKIRRIFEALLSGAYADGVIFSNLAPFSHAFYRMFGYELCCTRRETRVDVKEFEKFKTSGTYEQLFAGCDTSELQKIHEAYISDINHAIRRDSRPDNIMWRKFVRRDPYNTGCFIYIWRDAAGEARSFMKFQHKRENGASEIHVQDLMFKDKEALYAQFALAGGLSAEIKALVWEGPMFIDPADFVDVAWAAKQRLVPKDMTRVVNVKAALGLMRRPEGEGCFAIETRDPIIPENNGPWLVEYWNRGSRVTAARKEADIVCDLPALAQLVTGYRTLESMLATSRLHVEVRGNEKTLKKVFTPRPQHVTENF